MIEQVQSTAVEWAIGKKHVDGRSSRAEQHLVKSTPTGFLIAIVDAFGSDDRAIQAGLTAISILDDYTHQSVPNLLDKCDRALKSTGGVAITAAIFNTSYNTVSWFGMGNIEALLWHRSMHTSPRYHQLALQTGLAGQGLSSLNEKCMPVHPGDLVILTSDGIFPGVVEALPIEGRPRAVADKLLQDYAKDNEEATLLVTRYLGSGLPPGI
jgi:negative regulator of sigma-B (phosphoserine phosphatase)